MRARCLMIQGTGSHVGKSLIVTALCRIFRQDGFKVAPFKAQNMSLNSYATLDGGEIGRAQAVQAEACGLEPEVEMNPILLKPMGETGCQVVVLGRPLTDASAVDYHKLKRTLWEVVCESLDRLRERFELIVIEGAGSPAEVNLKKNDIVNMKVAEYARAPVILVGDIDRGGVFAWLIGTLQLLEDHEREMVKGFLINKFRGDIGLLRDGLDFLHYYTGKPVLGVIPYIRDLKVQDEDSVSLDERRPGWGRKGEVRVVVVRLPRISNFTDFDPLETEEDVSLVYTVSPDELEGADLIVLPGTKNTVADLLFLKEKGLAAKIIEMRRRGVPVIGICGGFQMLGRKIKDPLGVESPFQEIEGLALLEASTTFEREKATFQVKGVAIEDIPYLRKGETVEGYEIHMGRTEGSKFVFKLVRSNGEVVYDGMISEDGLVFGTYLHGIFDNTRFRRGILNFVRIRKGLEPIEPEEIDLKLERLKEYDKLAEIVRENVDIGMIYRFMGLG